MVILENGYEYYRTIDGDDLQSEEEKNKPEKSKGIYRGMEANYNYIKTESSEYSDGLPGLGTYKNIVVAKVKSNIYDLIDTIDFELSSATKEIRDQELTRIALYLKKIDEQEYCDETYSIKHFEKASPLMTRNLLVRLKQMQDDYDLQSGRIADLVNFIKLLDLENILFYSGNAIRQELLPRSITEWIYRSRPQIYKNHVESLIAHIKEYFSDEALLTKYPRRLKEFKERYNNEIEPKLVSENLI